MQPKTKLQKRVFELHKTLTPLTEEHKTYATENTFHKSYVISRNRHFCLECGHKWNMGYKKQWQAEAAEPNPTCPSCQTQLKNIGVNRKRFHGSTIMFVLDKCEEFQVIRYLQVDKWMEKECAADINHTEVVQRWIRSDGKETIISVGSIGSMSYYSETRFNIGSDLEIRAAANTHLENTYPECIYPKRKIIKELRRNGFKTSFHKNRPDVLFKHLLTNPKVETLLKAKQHALMRYAIIAPGRINNHWDSIKICLRNNYIVKNASDWIDMIQNLERLRKDVHSPKYVCPEDLHKAHNKWLEKVRELRKKQRLKEMLQTIKDDQKDYAKLKGLYFGLVFQQGNLVVSVCDSVERLYKESEKLKHCAYTNGYHKRKNSLMLSATYKGNIIETIEFCLDTFKVVQARGLQNKASNQNKKIVQLVNSHAKDFKRLHAKSKQQHKEAA